MKVKAKVLSGLILGTAIAVSGCGFNSNTAYNPPINYSTQQMQMDAKILGAVMVIDKNEISAASLAQKKSMNPAVRDYAAYLYNQHSQNLQAVQALSQRINVAPVQGEVAKRLQAHGRHMMATLNRVNHAAFDRVFIAQMIKGHTAALNLLNQKLIPMALNPLVKAQLEMTRNHVSMHLQRAMAIQSQLGR
ncbi:MAG: DUF4142 domain-containing protein [Tatlockia sp.]|nr:DUF4142 domain-containing protein [Tatlockia sp.]